MQQLLDTVEVAKLPEDVRSNIRVMLPRKDTTGAANASAAQVSEPKASNFAPVVRVNLTLVSILGPRVSPAQSHTVRPCCGMCSHQGLGVQSVLSPLEGLLLMIKIYSMGFHLNEAAEV